MPDELTALRTHRDGLQAELGIPGVTCCLVDIDGLIWVNDQFGHNTGDRVVALVAAQIGRSLASARHALFRVGGDDFLAVLHGVDRTRARQLAETILTDIRELRIDYSRCDHPERRFLVVNAVLFTPSADDRQFGVVSYGLSESLRNRIADAIYREKLRSHRHAEIIVELEDPSSAAGAG